MFKVLATIMKNVFASNIRYGYIFLRLDKCQKMNLKNQENDRDFKSSLE